MFFDLRGRVNALYEIFQLGYLQHQQISPVCAELYDSKAVKV